MPPTSRLFVFLSILVLGSIASLPKAVLASTTAMQPDSDTETAIHVNQTGYYPQGPKVAAFHHVGEESLAWTLRDADGQQIADGRSIVLGEDALSGDFVHHIDFSTVDAAGSGYTLEVGELTSPPFDIDKKIYSLLKEESLRYFYLSRSGIELAEEYADEYSRPAGHLTDDNVTCFDGEDGSGKYWPGCDYELSVSGGWYDAGDYGKYVVNGGISAWTMLNQYERNPAAFGDGSLRIPENNNGVPDILDEARWEMEFFLGMQVPQGAEKAGMVHHKVHDLVWHGMPSLPVTEQNNDNEHQVDGRGRYLYPPSTAATLNLAATAAQCSRIWADIDSEFAGQCLESAERAWEAAEAFPATYAGAVPGSGGGDYGDQNVADEFYWAAAELFVTTGKDVYRDFLINSPHFPMVPKGTVGAMTWGDTTALGTISLAMLPNDLPPEDIEKAREAVISAAGWYLTAIEQEGYRLPISRLEWGSSSAVLNNMIIMGLAYEFSGEQKYLDGMAESMDYLMGRNPLGKSFISGYGENPFQHPHHRIWANNPTNGWPAVPSGVVSGGPNETADDPTAVTAGVLALAPARRYIDDIGSWSTNEVTINWNAPLAWTAAFMDEHYGDIAAASPEPAPVEATMETPAVEPAAASEDNAQDPAQDTAGIEPPAQESPSMPWLWLALLIGALVVGGSIIFFMRRDK